MTVRQGAKHVCGHSTYGDMKTLFINVNLWTPQVHHNLATFVCDSVSCKQSSIPLSNRFVSLHSFNCKFNEVICLDHFNLGYVIHYHWIDSATWLSSAVALETASIQKGICSIKLFWLSQFWTPESIHVDVVILILMYSLSNISLTYVSFPRADMKGAHIILATEEFAHFYVSRTNHAKVRKHFCNNIG